MSKFYSINISFSVKPEVSDSTIKTASFVPATTRSNSESFNSVQVMDLKIFSIFITDSTCSYWSLKWYSRYAKAAEEAIIDKMSG